MYVDCARTRARAWHYVDIAVSFVDFATCFVLLFWLSCRRRSGSVSRLFLDFGILSEPKTPLKCLFCHTRRNVAARLQHEKLTLVKNFWELFVWASDRFCVSLCVFSYSFSHFWAHSNIMPMWWSSRAILIADDIHICIACVQYVCIFSETAKFTFKYRIIWWKKRSRLRIWHVIFPQICDMSSISFCIQCATPCRGFFASYRHHVHIARNQENWNQRRIKLKGNHIKPLIIIDSFAVCVSCIMSVNIRIFEIHSRLYCARLMIVSTNQFRGLAYYIIIIRYSLFRMYTCALSFTHSLCIWRGTIQRTRQEMEWRTNGK